MNRSRATRRSAFTLLELAVSTAMLALVATSVMVMVRTSYTGWNRHVEDQNKQQSALAVLRHIRRQSRQAVSVTAVTPSTDTSGSLSLTMANDDVVVWEHDAGSDEVRYGVGTATNVLAKGIEELTFTGLKLNGTDESTDGDLIHSIYCSTKFNISRPAGNELVTATCRAWVRSW